MSCMLHPVLYWVLQFRGVPDASPVHCWAVLQTLVMPEFGGFLLRPWVWKRWMTWVLLSCRKPTLELYIGSTRRLHACLWKLYFSDIFQEFRSKSYTHGLWFPELAKPLFWLCVMCQKVYVRATFGRVSKRDFPEFLKKSGLSAEFPSCQRVLQGGSVISRHTSSEANWCKTLVFVFKADWVDNICRQRDSQVRPNRRIAFQLHETSTKASSAWNS